MNRKQRRALGKQTGAVPPAADMVSCFAAAVRDHQAGRLGEAEQGYRQILARDPGHADSLNLLGTIAFQVGRHDVAVDLIGRAIARNGAAALYHNNLGCALQAMGRQREAAGAFQVAVRLQPDDADAHYNLGNAFYADGRLDAALAAFDVALRLRPDHAESHNNRGNALHALGRLTEAGDAFDTAIRATPDHVEAHYNRGNVWLALDRPGEAIVAFDAALRVVPTYFEAQMNRGRALNDLGWPEEALAAFDTALVLRPKDATLHTNIGGVLRDLGRPDEAVAAYRRAIAHAPASADAHCNLGDALNDLGRTADAIAAYETAARRGHETAAHLAAALRGETSDHAPRAYVTRFFDAYAPRFEAHLTGTLGYRAPRVLRDMLAASGDTRRFVHMADLGCGTGLSGAAFRDVADVITGIDLSHKMIARAAEKQIYDRLVVGDIAEVLSGDDGRYDLFVAADVLIYVGALDGVFAAVAARARPEARLLLCVECCDARFALLPSGRYAHSRAYLEAQVAAIGGRVLAWDRQPLRLDKGQPSEGDYLVVALAPGGGAS